MKAKVNQAVQLQSSGSNRLSIPSSLVCHRIQRDRKHPCTNSVCHCIKKDMLPFSTVNNMGFWKCYISFEPRHVLPNMKIFASIVGPPREYRGPGALSRNGTLYKTNSS